MWSGTFLGRPVTLAPALGTVSGSGIPMPQVALALLAALLR